MTTLLRLAEEPLGAALACSADALKSNGGTT
jgi:hypothetical protein